MRQTEDELRIGLLINPYAGIGGAVGLKGSDGVDVQARARALGGIGRGQERARRLLRACDDTQFPKSAARLRWYCWAGEMGSAAFSELPQLQTSEQLTVIGTAAAATSAEDTKIAARALVAAGIDLLIFVGGDGTARDVFDALGAEVLVLGVPAGVKMHSGVFATTPETAAAIVCRLAEGEIVSARLGSVTDLDESRLRQGTWQTRTYGEMRIPEAGGYLQHTKQGGRESEALALEEIVAWLVETISGQVVLGPGSSCERIKQALGLEPTLLGVDVWDQGQQTGKDVDANWLQRYAAQPSKLIVSFIRRQGFLFGRGNQQFSASWLRALPDSALLIVSSRTKLSGLDGRPLLVDTDDPELNAQLCGLRRVVVGYDDELWYRLATYS